MIIIPEIETVVILVPRTGSGSLWRAVKARYEGAVMLYRHMEADGVPYGYDRWRKIGVLREPLERLWSLYNYIKEPRKNADAYRNNGAEDRIWLEERQASAARPFEDWLLNDQTVFTHPYKRATSGFNAPYAVHHPIPEQRKSQELYLRPDLGTVIFPFSRLPTVWERLDLRSATLVNDTNCGPPPPLTDAGMAHMQRFFRWDAQMTRSLGVAFPAEVVV